jgi:hypothetical protein
MKTVFTKLTTRTTTEDPIYISRLQWESAAYIPDEVLNRLVIVDFKEDTSGTNSLTKNDSRSKATDTSI